MVARTISDNGGMRQRTWALTGKFVVSETLIPIRRNSRYMRLRFHRSLSISIRRTPVL